MPKFLANLDLNQNELQNAVVQVLSANPSSPVTGQIYYNSSSNVLRYYDGTTWEDLAAGSGGETNQNAFSTIAVSGESDVVADQKTDTLTFVAGSNVTITTTPASDSVTISASGDVASVNGATGVVVLDADDIDDTSTTNKFATSAQLTKVDFITITQAVDLDTLESNVATNNAKVSNVTTNLSTTANGTSLVVNSSDGTNASIPAATTSAWGAMTDEDKTKLDGIEASADVTDSANVTSALGSISVTAHNDVTSAGSGAIITSAERTKLSGIEASADVTDSANVTTALGSISVTAHSDVSSVGSGAIITSVERTKLSGISTNADVTATALPLISSDVTIGDASDVTVTTSGGLTVTGDLTVNGTTTTVDSTNTNIADALIELGSGNTGANSNDLGLILERGTTGNNAFIGWDESADKFTVGTTTATGASTGSLAITTGTLVANIEGDVTGDVTGNADTATALATTRNIALGGDLSGSANFDGSANITITATVADDSHNHIISNVDGLQTALDAKVETLSDLSITANATEINLLDGITTLSGSNTGDEPSASTTVAGIVELATNTETNTGTDTARATTPAGVKSAIDARTYVVSIGDGTNTSYTITHGLGTRDVIIQLYDASSYDTVFADVVRTNTTQATISFASAPTTNDVRVLVTKVV